MSTNLIRHIYVYLPTIKKNMYIARSFSFNDFFIQIIWSYLTKTNVSIHQGIIRKLLFLMKNVRYSNVLNQSIYKYKYKSCRNHKIRHFKVAINVHWHNLLFLAPPPWHFLHLFLTNDK